MSIVVLDFDETVTTADTIGMISAVPYSKGTACHPWTHYTTIYSDAYREFTRTAPEPISFTDEIHYQSRLRAVEMASVAELNSTRLFKGLTAADLSAVGREVPIRGAAVAFLRACKIAGLTTAILSVNWTSLHMRSALEAHGCEVDRYYVNELEMEGGKTTGRWSGRDIRTGNDKLEVIRELKAEFDRVVYVGDSRTDLLALAEADLGMVVPGSKLLENIPQWAKQLGVATRLWEEVEKGEIERKDKIEKEEGEGERTKENIDE